MDKKEASELIKEFLPENPDEVFNFMIEFNELMMRYHSAIREVTTKLEILNEELSLRNSNNPICSIQSRTKKPMSIVQKLKRKKQPVTLDSIIRNLNDVAGVRVICSFVDDIYRIADMLAQQDDVQVIEIKDYIRHPKPNGYRSYHMILEIPVFFSNSKQPMRVELQIRTVAMDFWASLEHQMKYKQDIPDADAISAELKECADVIAQTDMRMLAVREQIQRSEQKETTAANS